MGSRRVARVSDTGTSDAIRARCEAEVVKDERMVGEGRGESGRSPSEAPREDDIARMSSPRAESEVGDEEEDIPQPHQRSKQKGQKRDE